MSGRMGGFRLEELPQCQRRRTVLRRGMGGGWRDIVRGGGRRSSGLKNCRMGERREIVLRMGDWGHGAAAGHWPERGKGEFGLGDLPQGERREIVLRGVAEEGEAAGFCYERAMGGGVRLEGRPRGERRETVLRGAAGDGEGGRGLC